MSKSWQVGTHHPGGRAEPVTLPPPLRYLLRSPALCNDCTMQALHSAITPPAVPRPTRARPLLDPPLHLPANSPTSRQADKSESWKVGKSATQQASNGKREPTPGSFIRRITLTMRNPTRQNLLLALAHPHPAAPLPLLPARSHPPTWRSPLP